MDEPTTGLDPQVRQLIWDQLRDLMQEGVTILLSTHYMEEAYQIGDVLMIMDKGEKVIEGSPSDLLVSEVEPHALELHDLAHVDRLESGLDTSRRVVYYADDSSPSHYKLRGYHQPLQLLLLRSHLTDLLLFWSGPSR